MKVTEMKVGQIIKHDNGFLAEVKAIKKAELGRLSSSDIHLEITDSGTSKYRKVGDKYVALAECCTLVKDVNTNTNNSTKNNIVINVEVNGLEKFREELDEIKESLEEVNDGVEALVDLDKETTVFTAELGQGIAFKGTKSDFEAFIKGMSQMMKIGTGSSL